MFRPENSQLLMNKLAQRDNSFTTINVRGEERQSKSRIVEAND